jgi:carbon monoxide dehydrogenase subunit G
VVAIDPAGAGGRRAVAAAVLIDAPPQRVWEVMTDCPRAPEFVPGLRECRVLTTEGDRRTIAHRVKISSLLPEMRYTFREVQQPWHRIDFVRTGGDLREMQGSWTLEELDPGQRTLVRYRVSMDPGFLAPMWLVRQALRRNLPSLLAALRERVERGAG